MPVTAAQPADREVALERVRELAARLSGDEVVLPITATGDLDIEALEVEPIVYISDPDAPRDPARYGVLVDGFQRFVEDAPEGVSVVVLDRGGAPEVRQRAGEPFPAAVDLIERAVRNGTCLDRTSPRRPALRIDYGPAPDQIVANDNDPGAVRPARFDLTWFTDIADAKPKATFIKGVFGNGEFTTVSGLPGTGKSVILTDASCHVAAGMEWHGRRVTQGLVVYVAAERKALTERRMLAFRKRHGVGDIPLLVLGGRIDLTANLNDARAIAAAVQGAAAGRGLPCVWIVLDTLTRTFGAGDQNTSKDMGRYVASCDELGRLTGAHVTAVHHTAWSGERGKGAIDLDGAVDASFLVRKEGDVHSLICDGANDGADGPVCRFRMESVEVGIDDDGEPTTAPVVVPAVDMAAGFVAALKGHTAKALTALEAAVAEDGVEPDGEHFGGVGAVVTEEQWRARFYAEAGDVSQGTLKQRFARAKSSLLATNNVHQIGQWFWPGIGT